MKSEETDSSGISEIILTEDGSQTLISPIFGERYHSIYGAKTESQVVFLDSGLNDKMEMSKISILEMGFGTGLNALMTWIAISEKDIKITYTSFEKYPINEKVWRAIHYGSLFQEEEKFNQLHLADWDVPVTLSPKFELTKKNADINDINDIESYDIIYYDAFAPSCQDELWTIELFQKLYHSLRPNGILVTYCAKGYVKRNLKAAGFSIEPLPGPPGKREITRARKMIKS